MSVPAEAVREAHDWQPLRVETFSAERGGNTFYKAISHPAGVDRIEALIGMLAGQGPVAVYDPEDRIGDLTSLHDLGALDIRGIFAQRVEDVGAVRMGMRLRALTELGGFGARTVFVPAFDAARILAGVRPLLPPETTLVSLDQARLPDELISDPDRYLSSVNFATNFAFFRDQDGSHTRLVTSNYWARYGAAAPRLWCRLFDREGNSLASWEEMLPDAAGTVVIDSREVRDRFGLDPFTGQLFLHAVGIAGHDVVKYALDVWGDQPGHLSCTHDANAWPSDRYAGLPAPAPDESVVVWIQNSHARPIPAGAVGLAPMGSEAFAPLREPIPAYASRAVDTRDLLPGVAAPAQLELRTGRHVVRPRYEVRTKRRRWLAHVNVERSDLAPDPEIRRSGDLLGKGFILPAPLLPRGRWRTLALPTPMALSQRELPIAVAAFGPDGEALARRPLGRVARDACPWIDLDALLSGSASDADQGHLEFSYDFSDGGDGDGWLHGIFRYVDRESGHGAETSFGSHIFNTVMTFRREPQSYSGPPPGLSTRLFVRLGHAPYDTMLHLIYPASRPWLPFSETTLTLIDRTGRTIAQKTIAIPCGGSRFLRYGELFEPADRSRAGEDAHLIVRDSGCRLFGYHGLLGRDEFSLDHMFGS